MDNMKLAYPVYTLDNKELLPAGTFLSKENLNALMDANPLTYQSVSLFKHGSVAKDINRFMSHSPYDQIFDDQQQIEKLFQLMENVKVIPPVLQSLDFFKTNDFFTYRHMLMVFALSCFFGGYLIPDFKKRIQDAASGPTHDIGKINVPLHILKKKTALTRSEFNMLRHHTLAGYCLMAYYLNDCDHIASIVARDHHERQNGSGYPRGIRELSPMMEIFIVSDVYDALLSPRPYRPSSFDNRSAVEVITEMAENGEISWDIVKVLVSQNRANKSDYKEVKISLEKRGTVPEGNLYGVIEED
ncbi:MAG: HD domain-containing protein [Desulfobulbaceae bacterium]|nr:HD domain-containing protein [Desulfobulbaceae bacterium]